MRTVRTAGSMDRRRKPVLRNELVELIATFRSLFDPYRPELHYMRGPGPKWRARHAAPVAIAAPATSGLATAKA